MAEGENWTEQVERRLAALEDAAGIGGADDTQSESPTSEEENQ